MHGGSVLTAGDETGHWWVAGDCDPEADMANRAIAPVGKIHLKDQASAANADQGISGLLVLTGNVFVQVLEGAAQEVTGLFARIAADKRHRAVELVTF